MNKKILQIKKYNKQKFLNVQWNMIFLVTRSSSVKPEDTKNYKCVFMSLKKRSIYKKVLNVKATFLLFTKVSDDRLCFSLCQ